MNSSDISVGFCYILSNMTLVVTYVQNSFNSLRLSAISGNIKILNILIDAHPNLDAQDKVQNIIFIL